MRAVFFFCSEGEEDEDFLAIARVMEEIVDNPVDCYWLIRCFVNQFNHKFGDSIPHLVCMHSSAVKFCCPLDIDFIL